METEKAMKRKRDEEPQKYTNLSIADIDWKRVQKLRRLEEYVTKELIERTRIRLGLGSIILGSPEDFLGWMHFVKKFYVSSINHLPPSQIWPEPIIQYYANEAWKNLNEELELLDDEYLHNNERGRLIPSSVTYDFTQYALLGSSRHVCYSFSIKNEPRPEDVCPEPSFAPSR